MVPWYRFQRVGMPFNIRERTKRARIERDGEARIVADVKGVAEVMVDISDGRRARSERSRQKIIDALFTLVQSGEMKPSAARVAETANVSLRTVFRHFEEIDDLYREMAHQCRARILPAFDEPYASTKWKDQLFEHAKRRIRVFEEIMYLRICTESRRFKSDVLMADYQRLFEMERQGLANVLLEKIRRNRKIFAALDVALSFESYRRLRQESDFSVEEAQESVLGMINMILACVDD